jgi:outer membrane lipoprotein-sorting protein
MRKGIWTCLLWMLVCRSSQAQEGNTILQKMYAAYAALNSYSQRASSTLTVRGISQQITGSTSELRYRKPALLYFSVTNPLYGTFVASSNGREQIVYQSLGNCYRKFVAPATLVQFMSRVEPLGIRAILDPLYFLMGRRLENSAGPAKLLGQAPLNGVLCYKVTAPVKLSALARGGTGKVTFWIDRQSYLLRKVRVELKNIPRKVRVRVLQNKKPVLQTREVRMEETYTEVVQEMKVNPPLSAQDFNYTPPKGAIEQKLEKYFGS